VLQRLLVNLILARSLEFGGQLEDCRPWASCLSVSVSVSVSVSMSVSMPNGFHGNVSSFATSTQLKLVIADDPRYSPGILIARLTKHLVSDPAQRGNSSAQPCAPCLSL